jgi:protein-S-isoprenylcysteine O-methyltransferase Ste14
MQEAPKDGGRQRLDAAGVTVLVGTFFGAFIEGVPLFAAAGTIALPRAWFFLALSFVALFGQIALLAWRNPELVNHRGRWKEKRDAKRWDKPLVVAFCILGFYVVPIVVGLDVGRYRWSSLGTWWLVAGTALYVFGTVLITWAMLVNTHFETIVRIQTDRNHRVMTGGPYRFIRHPGYVGAGLWILAAPLIVGSACGLIPVALVAVTIVVRTALEDRTLHRELPGYADYAARVPYRLLPGVW